MVMPGGGAAIIIARVLVGGAIAQITGGIGDGGGGGGGGGVLYKSAPVTHCVCSFGLQMHLPAPRPFRGAEAEVRATANAPHVDAVEWRAPRNSNLAR